MPRSGREVSLNPLSPNSAGSGSLVRIGNREDLIFILSEASTLEHMIMCEYLFAAFSLKRSAYEGLTEEQLKSVSRWERTITEVAVQEMLHLSLVNNMLTAIGAAPYFGRPNFPQPSDYFPPNIRLALLPFGEEALRHFLYLERPDGMAIEGVPGLEAIGALAETERGAGIVPEEQYFSTVGNLYRGIEQGFSQLVTKYGERRVFIGGGRAQATEKYFGWSKLVAVTDLESATRSIEAIVTEGEGARGDWREAHFGKFLGILNEYLELKGRYPDFGPARPVVAAYVRPPSDTEVKITDSLTAGVADLFNASYGVALTILSRFFVRGDTTSAELRTLSDAAVEVMTNIIKPLGVLLTTLPVGSHLPGLTAGPCFEVYRRPYLLPGREEARLILHERLTELADHAAGLVTGASSPKELRLIEANLRQLATRLAPRTPRGKSRRKKRKRSGAGRARLEE